MSTDPNETARAIARAIAEAADAEGTLSLPAALSAVAAASADHHPAAAELKALNQDKAERDRALLDLLHSNPNTED